MFDHPQSEHVWFDDFLGTWEFSHRCDAGPDQPQSETQGTMSVRSLGGLWCLMDCTGTSPEGSEWFSQFCLGYDLKKGKFVGSFVASMMTHLWLYEGALDETKRILTLDVEGPRFDGKDGMVMYQDIFEKVNSNEWLLHSRVLGDDGQWIQFLEGIHRRVS